MTETHCLQCGPPRLRRSRRRLPIEYAIALAGWRMRRCHGCNTRFLQFGGLLVRANRLKSMGKRLLFAALAAAAVGLVLAAILWFGNSRQPGAPVEGLFVAPAATAPSGG